MFLIAHSRRLQCIIHISITRHELGRRWLTVGHIFIGPDKQQVSVRQLNLFSYYNEYCTSQFAFFWVHCESDCTVYPTALVTSGGPGTCFIPLDTVQYPPRSS